MRWMKPLWKSGAGGNQIQSFSPELKFTPPFRLDRPIEGGVFQSVWFIGDALGPGSDRDPLRLEPPVPVTVRTQPSRVISTMSKYQVHP